MDISSRTSLDELLDQLDHELEDREEKSRGSNVYLNVYDMVWLNNYTSRFGIGAFHTGVQVYDKEYAYGGHPYSYTGVYNMAPCQEDEIGGEGVRFRESLRMGYTNLSEGEVGELVLTLGKKYNGNAYHVLNKNCNHFTSDLCQRLCAVHPPSWINRLAYMTSWMPFLLNCLPPSWVTPGEGQTLYSSQLHSQSRAHLVSGLEKQDTNTT